jgi:hypothetical protein
MKILRRGGLSVLVAGSLCLCAAGQTTASYPFFDGFEDGKLAPCWNAGVIQGMGQVQVTSNAGPHTGNFHLTLDTATPGVVIVGLDLSVDLAGKEGVLLEFAWRDFKDSYDPLVDGIFVSTDGANFTKVLDLDGPLAGEAYQEFRLDLDAAVADAGLAYTSSFKIRFGWRGKDTIPNDGFAFDDVRLSSVGFSTLGKLVSTSPTSGGRFGASMARVADLNGDGVDELVVGHPDVAASTGRVEVFSGADFSPMAAMSPGIAGEEFGRALDVIGDLDGDGFDELLVGAPLGDQGGVDSGAAFVYSTKTGLELHRFAGAAAGDHFGTVVLGVEDVDGDGVMELFIGAPLADGQGGVDSGRAYLFSGASFAPLLQLEGLQAGAQFGSTLASDGDLSGDGLVDLVVGSPEWDAAGPGADATGQVELFSASSGQLLTSFAGKAPGDRFGSALAVVADLSGDGLRDLVVGAPYATKSRGAVRFLDGVTGQLLREEVGDRKGDLFGATVSAVGDMDGDGFEEVAVGTASPLPNSEAYVRVFRTPLFATSYVFHEASFGSGFGALLRGLGDLNGDGLCDVGLGSVREDAGGVASAGIVRIVSTVGPPQLEHVEGLHCTLAGDIVLHGTNLFGGLVATVDGVVRPVIEVSPVESRILMPVDLPGGFHDLELTTPKGSVKKKGVVARFPALDAPASLSLGQPLELELDNGEPGAFVLAFSNLKYATPAPFENFGWYYGLELNGVWITAVGAFGTGATAVQLTLPGTTASGLVGTPFYLQAWTVQTQLGLAGFSNTVTTTIAP